MDPNIGVALAEDLDSRWKVVHHQVWVGADHKGPPALAVVHLRLQRVHRLDHRCDQLQQDRALGLLLCYLIGLTYVAKQENLGRVENLWPLIFLAAPVVYGVILVADLPWTIPFLAVFFGWMLLALWFVKRRQPGDIPRAVVSLIAGISLLDALLIAGVGEPGLAILGVAGFLLTLGLQRFVPGT